jgi:hypothetical protein
MQAHDFVFRLPDWATGMKDQTIDERTPVPIRLGLIVILTTTLLGLCGGTIGGVWWWASWSSRIESKLGSIETTLAAISATNVKNGERIDDVDRRVTKIESLGSPHMQQIAKEVSELLRQFELHRAKEGKP